MACISQLNQFPCKFLSTNPPSNPQFTSRPSFLNSNSLRLDSIPLPKRSALKRDLAKTRPAFAVRAFEGEEYVGVVVEEEKPKEVVEIDELKKQLVNSFYRTDCGLNASSETRAEILELISLLEAKNPTPAPTEALPLLNGKWILAYTSFLRLFWILRISSPHLIKVEELSQTIDSENFTVENSILFQGPLATTSVSTGAKFEIRSPKRVQIKFEEVIIGTPQLIDSIIFPEDVEFLGQKVDLTPFKGIFTSVQDTVSSVARTISSQPPLKFSIANSNTESWLLTTYLDEDLCISRGDGGSVFVLSKAGCPLPTP